MEIVRNLTELLFIFTKWVNPMEIDATGIDGLRNCKDMEKSDQRV